MLELVSLIVEGGSILMSRLVESNTTLKFHVIGVFPAIN